jgi:ABC-type nitrate/sulfonate/bicarbonate transport system substrate-binding protein
MFLVLVMLFIATTTANITATRLESNIQSVRDLPGKSVTMQASYRLLQQFHSHSE